MKSSLLAKLILAGLHLVAPISAETSLVTGEPHSSVQTLTTENFDEALNDPANGLWLLKFYGELECRFKKIVTFI